LEFLRMSSGIGLWAGRISSNDPRPFGNMNPTNVAFAPQTCNCVASLSGLAAHAQLRFQPKALGLVCDRHAGSC
jgi:hypothetical protein